MPNPRGRPARPTTVKRLHGTAPGRLNDEEPVPDPAPPAMPEGFSETQRTLWVRVCEDLRFMGLLHRADTETITAYCVWADRHDQAQWAINKTGMLVRNRDGEPVPNPLLKKAYEADQRRTTLARELGLTPSARATLRRTAAQPGTGTGGGSGPGDLADVRELFG
jgi:P27 family predicted phage terminase small subunit